MLQYFPTCGKKPHYFPTFWEINPLVSQFWDLGIYIAYFPKLNTASGKLNPCFNLSQGGDFLSLAFPKIGNNILKYFATCAKIVPSFSHILGRKPIGLPTLVF